MSELVRIEMVVVLQTAELLSSCSAEQILGISAITQQKLFTTGELIYEEGDPADALYFVVRGSVCLVPRKGPESSVVAGETFGATEILSGRLRSGSAKVEEETLLLLIESEDFFDLLSNNIEIVKALFRQILERSPSPEGSQA